VEYNGAMNMVPHPLDKLISEARDDIAQAERTLERARDRLMTLQIARDAVGDLTMPARRRNSRQRIGGTRRQRSLSAGWQVVLRAIGRKGEADLDFILGLCGAAGLEITRESLRSQMFNYVKRGYLDRVREGVFQLTIEGRKVAAPEPSVGDDGASPIEGEAP
jgi:hypothetical protein